MEYIFHPRSIAVVGASISPSSQAAFFFIQPLLTCDYPGPIYPVNPKGGEVRGLKVYPALADVPGPVDLAIICVPAPVVPQVMAECAHKGVKVAQIYAAGFGEGGEAGERLEAEIVAIARRGGVRVIGPNCMGIYCPSTRLSFYTHFPTEGGAVGYLSQSGANVSDVVESGSHRGLRFSKVVSYGNACDLNECDFLEHLAGDPETGVIAMYIEGIRDGQRFVKALAEATQAKPVIVLKGGSTEAGGRATVSHTGSLAGDHAVWDALCRQMGVIQTYNIEDLIDILVTFSLLRPPRGRNVVVLGNGGGRSVQGTDDCERAGLKVPHLPLSLRQELREVAPQLGTSVRNPVDLIVWEDIWNIDVFSKTARLATAYDGIDLVIFHTYFSADRLDITVAWLEDFIVASKQFPKPVAMVFRHRGAPEALSPLFQMQQKCHQAGLPVYPSVGRAAQAISMFIGYHESRA